FRGVDRDCAYFGECSEKDGVPMLSLRRVQLTEPKLDASSPQPIQLSVRPTRKVFYSQLRQIRHQSRSMESGLRKLDSRRNAMRRPATLGTVQTRSRSNGLLTGEAKNSQKKERPFPPTPAE
ncbi:MAG: hypothetical protein QOI53_4278, partial [Verrucomicrobiota bacterium]|nr:hypothetical protein [Verrucomicrobiota bacterium]